MDQDSSTVGQLQSLQQMVLRQLDSHMQKNEVDFLSHMITQQWSKDSNVRARTIIPWEENAGVNLQDLGLYNDFLDMTLKVQAINLKRQIDFIKIKNFCASRISSNEERTYRMRKYLQTIYLMSSGIQNNKKLSKDLSKDFFKEDREE